MARLRGVKKLSKAQLMDPFFGQFLSQWHLSRLGAHTMARLRGVMPVRSELRESRCRCLVRWARVVRWPSGRWESR